MTDEPAPEEKIERKLWPRLHGDFLASSLLAYLRNWNAYGYRLVRELAKAGLPAFDSGTVYRTLRQLERAGLVSSFWDTSRSGPARRMYSLTKAGDTFLSLSIEALSRYQTILQRAVEGYEDEDAKVGGSEEGEEAPKPRRRLGSQGRPVGED
ncbi:MAG: helix-turn-helix transcriptional regulator [Dehalococcoidia bacterium]|nr:MAG: helix-turn-helix transcriptional regulator [Dehalococcoidia bacterium]